MWWLGALIGLALAWTGNGSALIFMICGGILGALLKMNLNAQLETIRDAHKKWQSQCTALIDELNERIARLESRLNRQKSQQESHQKEEVSATDLSASDMPDATLAASDQAHSEPSAKSYAASLTRTQAAPAVIVIDPNKLTPNTSHLPLGEAKLDAVSRTMEQESEPANVQIDATTTVKPIASNTNTNTTTAETPIHTRAPSPLQPPPPRKSLRESLPAPLANFIFGGNVLVKVGVLILFLGIAFLLRYTAEHVTVPVEFRYVGVTLTGMGLLSLGWYLRHKRRDYALSLQGMAIGVFYLTTLSALKVHMLIAPEMGFSILLVVAILSAALAVLQQAPVLAIIAALEGFVSPILTSTGANRPLGLFTYLAVLDVGIFLVAWFNAWRVLNLIAFVGTFTLSIGWAQKFYADSDYALVQAFLVFFFVLFALIGILFARRTLSQARHESSASLALSNPIDSIKLVGRVDSALVFGNPVTAFGLQYMLVQDMDMGAAFSAIVMAFFYLFLARLVFSKEKQGLALLAESYVIVAAIFGTLAIPLGLEGTWTSAAWAIEGAGMYWLGQRQQRPYARVFSLLVLVGASVKLALATSINTLPDQALLQGALLGPFLLGASALVMWRLRLSNITSNDNNKHGVLTRVENLGSAALPWLGFAALTCLPWMLFTPPIAASCSALFALLLAELCIRFQLPAVRPIAACIQALAVVTYLLGLHTSQDIDSMAYLQSDWRSMGAGFVIALTVLFHAGRFMLRHKREAEAIGAEPAWSWINRVAMLAGFGLLHLASLFAIDLEQAAALWPLTAGLVLALALWMSHGALALFAFGLQALSAALYLLHSPVITAGTFMHLGFFTPLALALAGWWSADRLQSEAKRYAKALTVARSELPRPWVNAWCRHLSVQWCVPVWALTWWFTAWISETSFALGNAHTGAALSALTVIIAIASSAILLTMARWRQWQQAGMLSALSLPFYFLCLFVGIDQQLAMSVNAMPYLPSAMWGWLAWPLAFVWFYFSSKRQEIFFSHHPHWTKLLHVLAVWFFLALMSIELRAQIIIHLDDLAAPTSSWLHLAWIIAPAWYLFGIGRPTLEKIWPFTSHRSSYLETAAAPVAFYLLCWSWISNLYGAGEAQPLPFIPLINPLEIAHIIVLLSLFLWWKSLPANSPIKLPRAHAMVLLAATAFSLLTASVLRAIHHFGGVPWQVGSLFDSHLAQAAVSITWALTGVALMLAGNRRASRTIWIAGTALLGVVVAKLFLIELADRGGLYRIISFMGVGIAFLVVGYFAPVPVKKAEVLE